MRSPTLKDVGEMANVSHTTVSRVLSGRGAISETTKRAVLAAVQETGYQPNPAARAMVSRRRGDFPVFVEVVLCHLDPLDDKPPDSFQSMVLRGIHDAISRDGRADYRLSYVQNGADVEPQLPRLRRANGVVLMGGSDRALCEGLLRLRVPQVLTDHDHAGLPVDAVISDNMAAGRAAVRYLLDRGHRRIGFLGGPPIYTPNVERLEAVRIELLSAGLSLADRDYRSAQTSDIASYEQTMESWAAEGDVPSALIVCGSMPMPIVMHVLREHGLKCPHDVSVVCFDQDVYTSMCRPTPTTFATLPRDIGLRAMERLLQIVRSEKKETPVRIVLPTKLVEGKSVSVRGGTMAAA
jgi:LacI family transcriptional regulator